MISIIYELWDRMNDERAGSAAPLATCTSVDILPCPITDIGTLTLRSKLTVGCGVPPKPFELQSASKNI